MKGNTDRGKERGKNEKLLCGGGTLQFVWFRFILLGIRVKKKKKKWFVSVSYFSLGKKGKKVPRIRFTNE